MDVRRTVDNTSRPRRVHPKTPTRPTGPDPTSWGSPLLEIERAVQERAKALALDMNRPDGRTAMRSLLDDEIRRWSDDAKRGIRSYDLADPDVWEIMINAPDPTFAQP